ncbi:4Fe-4S ferredoxin iron-sulfur binding domain protein [Ammonifex degensii KC4]|uniref:4Fe-4S ferredoxin iron-sulfur binding domain protein n=1 Tax=Ammonifex degensii (strain DSM 10501 / KC4) TaxID=429009 RepID=C9R897_AMMDK|nr:4Fe-4S binding protein [Ammonifex degensii]ACX52526.1 4Fe-4S ferredoxin iron-sulfur binding domain protein [Ammonifex degensii KC4]
MLREKLLERRKRQLYTWIGLPLVAVGGWFYPWLGFLLLGCMLGAVGLSFSRGRAWCDWMCPRGAFFDLFLSSLSAKRSTPAFFRSWPVRIFFLILIFAVIGVQWYLNWGNIPAMGLALVKVLTVTTLVGVLLGLIFHPRAWCLICPMGTLANLFGRGKKPLLVAPSCVGCGVCSRFCPLKLQPHFFRQQGVMGDGDCLKCGSCVAACPRQALSFGEKSLSRQVGSVRL